jgi:hypothetical protein
VGGKLSLVDVQLFCMLGDNLTADQCDLPEHRRECFGSKSRTDAALAAHPKIKVSNNFLHYTTHARAVVAVACYASIR